MTRRLVPYLFACAVTAFAIAVGPGAGPAAVSGDAALDLERLLEDVGERVEGSYYDRSRIRGREMLKKALDFAESSLEDLIVEVDDKAGKAVARLNDARLEMALPAAAPAGDELDAEGFGQARDRLAEFLGFIRDHDRGEVPFGDAAFAIVNAFLSPLDPHTNVMSPRVYRDFWTSTNGDFNGIGAIIGNREGQLTVIMPLPNSPAMKAGVRPGDKILEIEGESTVNMSADDAVNRIRGPKDTSVKLTLGHKDGTNAEVVIVRQKIEIPSIGATPLDGGLGYVRLLDFQRNTAKQLEEKLRELHARPEGLQGLILDLRGNHGGLLDQAVAVADTFVHRGEIVITEPRDPAKRDVKRAGERGTEPDYPLVVLVDAESASASEILCGALQAHDRAIVVGERTFGKGSVQNLLPLETRIGEAGLKITFAQYLLPGRISIQRRGVTPDIRLLPARIEKGQADLDEDQPPMREEDYDASLPSRAAPPPPPPSLASIRYLQPAANPNDEDTSSYLLELKIERDVPAQIGKAILEAAKGDASFSRSRFLEERAASLAPIRAAAGAKLAEGLKALGIDWSEEPEGPPPKVSIRIVEPAGPGPLRAKAGEPFKVRIEAKNDGASPARRLRATLRGVRDQDAAPLQGVEVFFGALGPGEARVAEAAPTVPLGTPARLDRMLLSLRTDRHERITEAPVAVETEPKGRPAFSIETVPTDANGDGTISAGERVTLKARVKNEGSEASKETLVTLSTKGEKRLFLRAGRQTLKDFLPGETREAEFSFEVKEGYEAEKATFDLMVFDLTYGEMLLDKLELPIAPAPFGAARAPRLPPRIELSAVPREVGDGRLALSGAARDEREAARVIVTVNGDKVFLKSGTAGQKDLPFEAEVPLQEGMNEIRITARDGDRMSSRQTVYVRRTPPTGPAPVAEPGGAKPADHPPGS